METEMMTKEKNRYPRFAPWAMAFALLLAGDVLAQAQAPAPTARVAIALGDDMRLWSFGDCERRFPYFDTEEHKQCVRVVGSPEARDARALRVCEVSHNTDLAEIDRCKATYQANKERALRDGWAVNPSTQEDVQSAEVMRRVKAITSAAVEENRVATQAPARPTPRTHPPESPAMEASSENSSVWKVGVVLLLVAVVGLGANAVRRKQAQSA
jgi:hypothetical protein